MTPFEERLVEAIPILRAYGRSLSKSRERAEDLVQETMLRALANEDKFQPGTSLHAWLVTILRNQFYSEGRKKRREVEDVDGVLALQMSDLPNQEDALHVQDLERAIQLLPAVQQYALLEVGLYGHPYEEVAKSISVRIGTIKSRVSRGRDRLEELLASNIRLPDHPTRSKKVRVYALPSRPVPTLSEPTSNTKDLILDGSRFVLLHTLELSGGQQAEVFGTP